MGEEKSIALVPVSQCLPAHVERRTQIANRVFNRLATSPPDDSTSLRDAIRRLVADGKTRYALGELEDAFRLFEEACNIAETLAGRYPESTDYFRVKAGCLEQMGNIRLDQNNLSDACKYYDDCLYTLQILVEREPSQLTTLNSISQKIAEKLKDSPPDRDGRTLLIAASAGGYCSIVRLLLDQGYDPNQANTHGFTALMFAAVQENNEVVTLLLDRGADPNLVDNDGWTALMTAAVNGYNEVATLLLDRGADPNQANTYGCTALMEAATSQENNEVVTLLLDRGADPNLVDNDGWTALRHATSQENNEVVTLLLDRGADPNLVDNDNFTALVMLQEVSVGLGGEPGSSSGLSQSSSGRFSKDDQGIIKDMQTGLQWFVGPNSDTDWYQAQSWAQSLSVGGGGWRLPTRSELAGLYGSDDVKALSRDYNVKRDPIFQLGNGWVWSGEIRDSSSAWFFDFIFGKEYWFGREDSDDGRAFAVRSR